MTRRHTILTTAAILALALTGTALADDDPATNHRMVILGDGGDHATVTLDGSHLQVVSVESGVHRVHEIDLSMLGAIIDGAVSNALSQLDREFTGEIEVDADHQVHIRRDHGTHTIDLSGVAARLEASLAHLHAELDREFGHWDADHEDEERDEAAELREELDALKQELRDLRRALRDLR
jgi:hypothetical protein